MKRATMPVITMLMVAQQIKSLKRHTSDSLVSLSNKCVSANVTEPCELKGPVDQGVYKNPHKHDGKLHQSICLKCSDDIHA